jgi:hypothetical protein
MNSEMTSQVSNEIESALSEVLPDLVQVLKHYGVSESVEIRLRGLKHFSTLDSGERCTVVCSGSPLVCHVVCIWDPENPFTNSNIENTIVPNPEETQQFCADIESKLPMVAIRQSVLQTEEVPEIYINIDPALVDNVRLSCKFVDGVIICSDRP